MLASQLTLVWKGALTVKEGAAVRTVAPNGGTATIRARLRPLSLARLHLLDPDRSRLPSEKRTACGAVPARIFRRTIAIILPPGSNARRDSATFFSA
jgi:hypothetical protein